MQFFQIWVIFIKELSYFRKQNQKLMNSSWKNIEYSHYLVKSNQLLSIYFVCVATGFINHLAPYPVLFLCCAETVLNFMPYNDWKLLWVLMQFFHAFLDDFIESMQKYTKSIGIKHSFVSMLIVCKCSKLHVFIK